MRPYGPAPYGQDSSPSIPWPLAIAAFLICMAWLTADPDLQAVARSSSPHHDGGRATHSESACPVDGRVRFANDWHAPRQGHLHQGTDLFANHGTPVVAVERGTVGKVGYAGIGGLRVWLSGRSRTAYYYAHLSAASVHPGQRVSRGQRLGRVGNTGNAAATPPHLHFEVHPGGGAAVNPYPSVRRWCR